MISVKQKYKKSFIMSVRLNRLFIATILLVGLTSSAALVLPSHVFAAGSSSSTSAAAPPSPITGKGFCTNAAGKDTCPDKALTKTCTNTKCDFIGKYVNPAIDMLTVIFGLIAAASMIAGGIQFSMSAGDPQKASAAKNRIQNTVIAVIAYLFMFSFLEFLVPGGLFNR